MLKSGWCISARLSLTQFSCHRHCRYCGLAAPGSWTNYQCRYLFTSVSCGVSHLNYERNKNSENKFKGNFKIHYIFFFLNWQNLSSFNSDFLTANWQWHICFYLTSLIKSLIAHVSKYSYWVICRKLAQWLIWHITTCNNHGFRRWLPQQCIQPQGAGLMMTNYVHAENPSLSLFLSSLVCIYLGYLRTDISGIDQASSFHLTHISLSFTVLSFTPIFYAIWLVSVNE